jgi:hypothetical protein
MSHMQLVAERERERRRMGLPFDGEPGEGSTALVHAPPPGPRTHPAPALAPCHGAAGARPLHLPRAGGAGPCLNAQDSGRARRWALSAG